MYFESTGLYISLRVGRNEILVSACRHLPVVLRRKAFDFIQSGGCHSLRLRSHRKVPRHHPLRTFRPISAILVHSTHQSLKVVTAKFPIPIVKLASLDLCFETLAIFVCLGEAALVKPASVSRSTTDAAAHSVYASIYIRLPREARIVKASRAAFDFEDTPVQCSVPRYEIDA